MSEKLWPDFTVEERPPSVRRVLMEAGEELKDQTEGKLELQIQTAPASAGGHSGFVHHCSLWVPALRYGYPLFQVTQTGKPYPVMIVGESGPFQKGVQALDEMSLRQNLKQLFSREESKTAVFQLLDLVSV